MKTFTFNRLLLFVALCAGSGLSAQAQFSFVNSNSLTPTATHSGCSVSVADINNDGLDDIIKMDQATTLVIEMQNQNGTYTHYNLGVIATGGGVWGMAVADVDHNGWKDVVTGNYGALYLVKLSWTGGTIAAVKTTLSGSYFVQNITFGDFNNDGWVDVEVCDDNDYAKVYVNNAGNLTPTTTLINTNINPGLTYGNDPYDSGNYGSVWTDIDNDGDLDLYIAHCRQSTNSNTDQRRRDRLFINNGSNVYSEQGQAHGIEVTDFKQSWTTSFGDIDNDGDMDIVVTNHGENGQILLNDGTGHFSDITATTGFTTPGTDPIESMVEDFDNDGFLDILVTGGGPGDSYFLYHNNGNKTFTLVNTPFASTTNGMLSAATGDLNHDGKIDVFASYGNVYNTPTTTADVVYLNTTNNTNHFITFNLTGTVSNLGAIGAKVTIYGPWGKQVREVRSGEAYGTSNSLQLHFGLGTATTVDSAVINWPSHLVTNFGSLNADQFVTAIEGGCNITGNIIPGPHSMCTGGSVDLHAPAGYTSYLWSNGATTQTLTVSATGFYNVQVTNASGCKNISATIEVTLNPNETPTVTSSGGLTFCGGGSVNLTSTPAASYLWSNGATTQTINVTASGTYAVTIQGTCAQFSSTATTVNVLANPVASGADQTSGVPTSFNLTATGNNLSWYDLATGGTLLGTGPNYTTPIISVTTTYWVENSTSYPGPVSSVGRTYGSGTYANTVNGGLDFNVTSPCLLQSVKVYTDAAHHGIRQVQIKNAGGTVIDSVTINVTSDSTVVPLNVVVNPGTAYRITTNATIDNTNFGAASPFLQRSTTGIVYPYSVNNLVSITNGWTGTAVSSTSYYYFYDWKVSPPPVVCVAPRIPINAIIDATTGINNFTADNNLHIYPNPASESVTVSLDNVGASSRIEFIDAVGRVITSAQLENTNGNFQKVFDISNFARGIYTIHVTSADKTCYRQMIVQ